jgi:hypothetical protein
METDLLGIGVGSIMASANDLPRRLTGEIIVHLLLGYVGVGLWLDSGVGLARPTAWVLPDLGKGILVILFVGGGVICVI